MTFLFIGIVVTLPNQSSVVTARPDIGVVLSTFVLVGTGVVECASLVDCWCDVVAERIVVLTKCVALLGLVWRVAELGVVTPVDSMEVVESITWLILVLDV